MLAYDFLFRSKQNSPFPAFRMKLCPERSRGGFARKRYPLRPDSFRYTLSFCGKRQKALFFRGELLKRSGQGRVGLEFFFPAEANPCAGRRFRGLQRDFAYKSPKRESCTSFGRCFRPSSTRSSSFGMASTKGETGSPPQSTSSRPARVIPT